MLSLRRLLAMARKEAIQLRRDRRSMLLAFLLPVGMLLFFGYAINWDVKDIPLAVLDRDGGQRSRALVDAFGASGYFELVAELQTEAETEQMLQRDRARAVLVIPPDFSRDLAAGRRAEVQFLLDGSDANTAIIAMNYADAIVARHSTDLLLRGQRFSVPVTAETRVWYNPTLESQKMVVPGLIAVIMSIIAALLTALTIAREWERGTMEQLVATPVHRFEVVLGKLLPYVVIGLIDVAVAVLAGILIFQVPFHGSILLLAGMTLLFLIGALGFGIFISAVVKSQVLATQAAMLTTFLPAILLSGFLFDIANMPWLLRAITYAVPARYFIAVTRGILLKGVGVEVMWVQGLSMIIFATVGLGLATIIFRKRLEA